MNQLKVGVQANVVLYDMGGALLTTKQLYLEANSQQSVSIKHVLSEGGFYSQAGSAEVITPQHTAAVLGQLSITRNGTNKAYLDEELFMPKDTGSQMLRAVIDSPENSPIIAITNVSGTNPQTLHISCASSSGETVTKTVSIQPKQTKLVRACSALADVALSADSIDAQFVLAPESTFGLRGQRVAGITITTDGPAGELAAFGFVEHSDNFGRYFSAMNFADPKELHSTGTIFTGVPVGASRLLPEQSYTPQVAVTNFSAVPQTVNVFLAKTTGASSQMQQVATIIAPAGASRFIELKGLTGDPDWQNSFIVRSSGQPGEVVSKMMFKSTGQLPNIELIGKDEHGLNTGGDHPWSIENGTRSTLFLFNHSAKVETVTVRIGSGADVWLKMIDVAPNETKAFSLNDVIGSRVLDDKQHPVEKHVTSGEVQWWAPSNGSPEVTGRVVQIDGPGTMARNFSCGNYIGVCQVGFNYSPLQVGLGYTGNQGVFANYCSYYPAPPTGCYNNNNQTYTSTGLYYSYISYNTNILSLAQSNGSSSAWQGLSTGSTTTYVTVSNAQQSGNSCQAGAPANVFSVALNSADVENNQISVTLSGPSSASALTISLLGGPAYTYTYNNGQLVGPGTITLALPRNSIPAGTYTSISAKWNAVNGSLNLNRKWIVLGTIRHSQYNTVYETKCSGTTETAYIHDAKCSWHTATLVSGFVSQVTINGTGSSISQGILKYDDGSCSSNRPPGWNSSASVRSVSSVTGQCNVVLVGGSSVATQPGPQIIGSKFNCGDNMQLVNSGNVNAYLKYVWDQCANTAQGCADGHVDNYSSAQGCTGRDVGDLSGSPYWTVDDQ